MKSTGLILILLLLASCAPSPQAALPTLAVLPTATPLPATIVPHTRPTLPPTFTPTPEPSATPLPATASPTATPNLIPTSAIGDPLSNPDNFPVRVQITGACGLSLTPPPAISYAYADGAYTLTATYHDGEAVNFMLTVIVREGLATGDYPLVPCASDPSLDGDVCMEATYINAGSFATYSGDSTLTHQSSVPLSISLDAPLALDRIPERDARCGGTSLNMALTIEGQGLTIR